MASRSEDGNMFVVGVVEMTNVLLVEDNATVSGVLYDTISKIEGFEAIQASQAPAALQIIDNKGIEVALVDLKLSEPSKPSPGKAIYNGIQLGEDIRKRSPTTLIVMYSADIVLAREKDFRHYSECVEAGADYILARETLSGMSAKRLGTMLAQWMAKKQADHIAARPLEHEEDWNTLGTIEAVGEGPLSQLVRQAIPDMSGDSVRALRPGYSGAFLLWVTSSTTNNEDVDTILKITRSPLPLQDELRRLPIAGSALDLNAKTPSTPLVESQGWYAIGIRPVKNAVLLRDFLAQPPKLRKDQQVFTGMIGDLLVNPVKSARVNSSTASGQVLLGYRAGSQILDVLDQMATWKSTSSGIASSHLGLIRRFIERSLRGYWTLCGNYRVARLHGDFHSRNVFVSSDARATLIDFGRSDVFPRLIDFAGLEADLLISVLDCTQGDDLKFSNVKKWCAFASSGFPFKETPQKILGTESRLSLLRKLLHMRMLADLEHVVSIEYSEALLFQILRYLRFPTTTAPKKILAVRLAASLISQHRLDK
jgi:DNA-binding NarL/FixJ family response regulator